MPQLHINTNLYDFGNCKVSLPIIPSGSWWPGQTSVQLPNDKDLLTYGDAYGSRGVRTGPIYNPMPIPDHEIPYDIVATAPLDRIEAIRSQFKGKTTQEIRREDLTSYAGVLVTAGLTIKQENCECFICPLRGAFKPSMYLERMNIIDRETPIYYIPFTQGSSGKFEETIFADLEEALSEHETILE
jgi:hypothetical protein